MFENINYIYLAVLSAFFASISNVLVKSILGTVSSKDILGINFILMGAILLLFSPFFFN